MKSWKWLIGLSIVAALALAGCPSEKTETTEDSEAAPSEVQEKEEAETKGATPSKKPKGFPIKAEEEPGEGGLGLEGAEREAEEPAPKGGEGRGSGPSGDGNVDTVNDGEKPAKSGEVEAHTQPNIPD